MLVGEIRVDQVLEFFGGVVDMIGADAGLVDEVAFPLAMLADDRRALGYSFFGECDVIGHLYDEQIVLGTIECFGCSLWRANECHEIISRCMIPGF